MARPLVLAATLAVTLLAVSGAGGANARAPTRGGTLVDVVPARAEPACLNPFTCGSTDMPLIHQVLEGAFETGPDLVPRPNLVSAVTPGRHPFTLTYHIRPNARWSDGAPVTARDFKFTNDAFVAHLEPVGLYANVLRARVLDAKTFQVELRRPFAAWRSLYDLVLPQHVLIGQDVTKIWADRIDNPKTGQPISSGPFLVSRLERGRQMTFVRNPTYWGPHTAYLDRLVERFVEEDPSDPLSPLENNTVDVGLTLGGLHAFSSDEGRDIRKLPGWRVAVWPGVNMEHFTFRVGPGGHPALRLKLVRRALAFGIDRVAIAREIQQDAPARSRHPLDSTVFNPSERSYQPTWSGYRYDVVRARRLLERAGCRRGSDGIDECVGERLRLRFVTTSGNDDRERILTLAAAQLRAVGVEVDAQYVPSSQLFKDVLPSGDFDVALFAWGDIYGGQSVWPEALCGGEGNWGGYCSRLVTRDAQENLIGGLSQRARVLHAVDRKLAKAVPALPLVQPVARVFYRSNVRGIVPGGTQFEFYENSENWWLDR